MAHFGLMFSLIFILRPLPKCVFRPTAMYLFEYLGVDSTCALMLHYACLTPLPCSWQSQGTQLSSAAHTPVLPLVSSMAFSYRGWHQSTQCISSSRLFGVLSSGTVPWLSLCCVVWTCSKSTGYHLVIIFHLCTLCRGLCM